MRLLFAALLIAVGFSDGFTLFTRTPVVFSAFLHSSASKQTSSSLFCSFEANDASSEAEATLRTLLSSRSSLEKKASTYEPLRSLRQSQDPSSTARYLEVLKEMFEIISSVKGNKWCNKKLPLIGLIPSFRLKLGSLSRVLETTIEDRTENGRNRALLVILSELSRSKGGIIRLENQVLKASRKKPSMEDMFANTPKGLETPTYTVVDRRTGISNDWEVRKYDDFTVCATKMDKARGPAGFNTLAGYIFGANKEQKKMAMTTPVITSANSDEMSFIMPSAFWEEESLSRAPMPIASNVSIKKSSVLETSNDSTFAVLWFNGYAIGDSTRKKKAQLLNLVEADSKYELVNKNDQPFLMQYNDPFQPGWRRRNEVAVAVKLKGRE